MCGLRRRNTRYKNPKLVAQYCFVSSFWSMFLVFHLAGSTCRATKTFFAGWRNLLLKVEPGSTLSNKFWLCCWFFIKLSTCHATNLLWCRHLGSTLSKSTNQRAAFLQPATNVFVARQVDPKRWKTRNIDQKLETQQCCATSLGFLYPVFRRLY